MEKQGWRVVDTTVFGIAAGISVLFVLVGVLFKDDMAVVVGDILSWVLTNLGWLFVLSTAAFLIFVVFLAVTPYGRIRLGKDDDRPEFRTISWIAMMFSAGHGHRPDVLRRGRAHLAPRSAAARAGQAGHRRGGGDGDGVHLLPLGAASLGALCGRGPGARVLLLPQGLPEPDQHRVPAAARRSRGRADRQGHRHPRHLRDDVRQRHLARPRRPADQQRAELRLGRGDAPPVSPS